MYRKLQDPLALILAIGAFAYVNCFIIVNLLPAVSGHDIGVLHLLAVALWRPWFVM
ncbi:MAG: hypothetical protein GKR94_13120 [Gammaproteobacteria bacterium]|nr:hypothetical protein [Gammaproteobacteria bacterium]